MEFSGNRVFFKLYLSGFQFYFEGILLADHKSNLTELWMWNQDPASELPHSDASSARAGYVIVCRWRVCSWSWVWWCGFLMCMFVKLHQVVHLKYVQLSPLQLSDHYSSFRSVLQVSFWMQGHQTLKHKFLSDAVFGRWASSTGELAFYFSPNCMWTSSGVL